MDAGRNISRNEGTFVMLASELRRHPHPNPYYHLNPMHMSKSETLSKRLETKRYTPWHRDFRLEAVVSQETWMKRVSRREVSIEFGNGRSYTRLRFGDDGSSEVHITEGLAFLDFAKSRDAELSWVVVDVLVGDTSYVDMAAEHVEHKAAHKILSKPFSLPEWKESSPLGEQHFKELINVCKIEALADAFAPLTQLPPLWPRLNMAMFSDMRKCWCFEEITNYLKHMIRQFDEMTLNLNPHVLPFIDPGSLMLLESRAPMLSTIDRFEISELFKDRKLFPGLEDSRLRTQVEVAVCRQGPILSFATLAKDLHVLVNKIHTPLSKLENVMGEMHNRVGDTVRRRVMAYFELLEPKPLQTSELQRGNTSPASCYETLFINLLRGMYTQLTEQDLNDIASRWHCNITRDLVVSIKNDTINELSKRHGTQLFNRQSVMRSLHWREDYRCSSILRASSIARYLTYIFLFGEPTVPMTVDSAEESAASDVVCLGNLYRQNEERSVQLNPQNTTRGEGTMVSRHDRIKSWRAEVERISPYSRTSSRSSWRVARHETSPTHNAPSQCSRRSYRCSDLGYSTPMSPEVYRCLVNCYPYAYDDSSHHTSAILHQEQTTNDGGQGVRLTPHSPPNNSSVYSTTSSARPPRLNTLSESIPRSSTLSGSTVCHENLHSPSTLPDWDDQSTGTAVSRRNTIDGGRVSANTASSDKFDKERAIESRHNLGPLPFQLYGTNEIYIINRTKQDVERFLENQPDGTTFSCQVPIPDGPFDPDHPPRTKTFSNFPNVVDNLLDREAQIGHMLLSIGPVSVRTTTKTWVPSNLAM